MPRISQEKAERLESHGYVFVFRRMIYVNPDEKKLFSAEAIDDHDIRWLEQRLAEPSLGDAWMFFFNTPPSESVRQQLLADLRGPS
jgi:hypothetical protein